MQGKVLPVRQLWRKRLRESLVLRIFALVLLGLLFSSSAARRSLQNRSTAAGAGQLRAGGPSCPEGQYPVGAGATSVCSACRDLRCGTLPGATLVPGFNGRVEAEIARVYGAAEHLRGFNPSMVDYRGRAYFVIRAANYTLCPSYAGLHVHANNTEPPYESKVLVCPADEAMAPAGCTDLPLDFATMERPGQSKASKVHPFSVRNRGLEDPRPFVWRDRVHLLGTVHVDRSPRWAQPRLALLRLSEDLRSVERSALLECAGVEGTQKNYMPLVLNSGGGGNDGGGGDDELYLVVQAQSLVVGRVDPASLACAVVQQEERVDPALGRVLSQGSFLSGGSPFVPLDSANTRYLALVHHYAKHRRRVYFHHFVAISAVAAAQQAQQAGAAAAQQEGDAHGGRGPTAGEGPRGGWRFRVDWVSEPFRLPNSQPQGFGVQFATGLLRAGSDSALYISYGISDCFATLARVEGIEQRLWGWRERGMGTQHPAALQQ